MKQMVLAFFNAKGVIYTNYVPRGETVNADYIKKALARFLVVLTLILPSCLYYIFPPSLWYQIVPQLFPAIFVFATQSLLARTYCPTISPWSSE